MAEENTQTETEENKDQVQDPEIEEQEPKGVDVDKTIEKLQKRLGKEQADKNTFADQLKKAQERIDELEKQGTESASVKQLSDKEKAAQAQAEKDKTIAQLKNELKLSKVRAQTDDVLKEAGLSVGSELLDVIASVEDDKTYANAKALINFANQVAESTRKELLKGKTPTDNVANPVKVTSLKGMSLSDRSRLAEDDPTLYNKLKNKL